MADLNLDLELGTTGDLDSAAQMLAAGEEAKEEAKERGEKECKELSTRMESCVEDNTLTEDLKLGTTGDLDSAAQLLAAGKEAKEEERGKREKELSTRMEPCVEDSTLTEVNIRMKEEERKKRDLSNDLMQWLADNLTEEKCQQRRKARLTFYQKKKLVINHLFASVKIAKHENQLMYDLPIQIQSEAVILVPEHKQKPVLQLSVLITESRIDKANDADMLQLDEYSLVTVSYGKTRVRRNVFTCESLGGKDSSSPVLYGEDLFIRLFNSEGPKLYLTGDVPDFPIFDKTKHKILLSLTDDIDHCSIFRIVDPDPHRAVTLRNTPVPTFAIVAISHGLTDQLLAVELTKQITTSFAVDHPAELYTYNPLCCTKNYWKFVTQAIDEDDELVSSSDDAVAAGGAGPSTSQ